MQGQVKLKRGIWFRVHRSKLRKNRIMLKSLFKDIQYSEVCCLSKLGRRNGNLDPMRFINALDLML